MKGFGYLISTLSVLLLGVVAWPSSEEPGWKAWAVLAGAGTSCIGMFLRYLSHRNEKRKIDTLR